MSSFQCKKPLQSGDKLWISYSGKGITIDTIKVQLLSGVGGEKKGE